MRKKILFILGALLALCVLGSGLLAFVYFKDTRVPYRGRVRLHYNWNYVFSKTPKFEHKYDGKLFSFSYLSTTPEDTLRVFDEDSEGFMVGGFLKAVWSLKVPAGINSELSAYLSSDGRQKWKPTLDFSKWLFEEVDKSYVDNTQKVYLRDGTPAAVLTVLSIKHGLRGNFRYLVAAHNGVTVKIKNTIGSSANDEQYKKMVFEGFLGESFEREVYPDGDKDWKSQAVFNRVLKTFEFKK